MNEFYIRNVIEAALLAAGKPLQLAEIGQLFDENTRPKVDDLRAAIDVLAADYSSRGIEVKETAAGFRIQVRREFASEISRLWPERPAKYSRALLETLALIAYRQPITRAEIEAVRGVAVNPNIIKTVIERNWVRVVGHRDVPGRPELLGTTREFLDYFGLRSLDELPPLAELKAMGDYNLQLELPNGVTPDGEPKLLEGEGGAPVAGLLTSDAAANADDASADTNAAGPAHTDADGAADIAHDAGANTDIAGDAVAHTTTESQGVEDSPDAGAHDDGAGDAVAHTAANPNGAEGSHDEAAPDHSASDAVAHTTADSSGVEDSHDAAAHDHSASDAVAGAAAEPHGAEGSHGTAAGDHGAAEMAHDVTANSARAARHTNAGADEDFDAAAERTLAAGDAAKNSSAESDDSDTSVTSSSGESFDALDDGADDDADDDELSADGHGSRELVAAPPDLDD